MTRPYRRTAGRAPPAGSQFLATAAAVIIGVAFSPIIVPLFLWYHHREKRRELRLVDQRRNAPEPRGMKNGKRRRAIASKLSRHKTKTPAVPTPQPDCSLLDLPFELRQLIWKEYLGGGTIHLLHRTHRWCRSIEPQTCDEPVHDNAGVNPMSLFLTCRQIYSETSDVFYSSNSFTTTYRDHIEYLPRFLPRSRINTIHSLRFVWSIWGGPPLQKPKSLKEKGQNHKYKVWVKTWSNIASMEGLRVLRIRLRIDRSFWENISANDTRSLLEPIRRVTIPKTFELFVSFKVTGNDEHFGPWRSLPCEIHQCENTWHAIRCNQIIIAQSLN